MKSFRKTMVHNERRAADMRFRAAETVRANTFNMREDFPDDAPEGCDSYIAFIFARKRQGEDPSVFFAPAVFFEDNASLEALKMLYETLMDNLDDPLEPLGRSLAEEEAQGTELVGTATVESIRGMQGSTMLGDDEYTGTLCALRFVDDSEVVFLINEEGLVDMAAATDKVAYMAAPLKISRSRLSSNDQILRQVTKQAREHGQIVPENLDERIDDADFYNVMVAGILTMSPEERQMLA